MTVIRNLWNRFLFIAFVIHATDALQQLSARGARCPPTVRGAELFAVKGDTSSELDRRRFNALSLESSLALLGISTLAPTGASAEETAVAGASASDVLLRLRSIPTFCLVNEEGIPFMIFDGQASATGYFFLSFQVAAQALEDARNKDKAEGATAVWSKAKIIVVPLAVALQLTLRKTQREAINNGIKFNTYNDIVPSAEGVEDAKRVESKSNPAKWEQKGRVPLFYIGGMTLSDGREPRYFNRADLVREWFAQNPGTGSTVPPVNVVEFVDLYRMALSGNNLKKISNLAIMPVQETNQLASKLLKSSEGGPPPKYDFNKVFLVGSAS